jgi:putative SOS response-associated peptidase YedK
MVLTRSGHEIADAFDLAPGDAVLEVVPRYNVAPTQSVVAVRTGDDGARHLAWLHWGLVPFWARDKSIGNRMINARAETAAEKPAFRAAMRHRRCVVPADGFYEWLRPSPPPGTKGRPKSIPHYFTAADGALLAIAGLWEEWTDKTTGEVLESCTLLTTEAGPDVRPIHHRMPVLLAPDGVSAWLDPATDDAFALDPLLHPAPEGFLTARRVGTAVNDARHDGPDCIAPV